MKKVVGWGLFVLGVLFAIYPVGWGLQRLGRSMQGLTGPPFELGSTVTSVLIGGALILGGWKLSHARSRGDSPQVPERPDA